MVWVEQPVGTGFTQGEPTATSTEEAAEQFLGFFKNFLETFDLCDRKVYITGESYAGKYIPYFADAMLNTNDKAHFDVRGIMIYDPSVASDAVLGEGKESSQSCTLLGFSANTQQPLLFPSWTTTASFSTSTPLSWPTSTSAPTNVATPTT
jgi:carboxypeptidase C (cathepsin A)